MDRRRRSPDAFDVWLGLVNDLVVEPVLGFGRQVHRTIRRHRPSHRCGRRRRDRR
jgi:hypothetical protein